jgi:hypothetical protein
MRCSCVEWSNEATVGSVIDMFRPELSQLPRLMGISRVIGDTSIWYTLIVVVILNARK